MSREYDVDNENSLLPIGDEIKENKPIVKRENDSEEYYDLPLAIRSRTLLWSVISLICGVLSILLSPYYYVGFVFAIAGIAFSLVSRKILGFFEKYSIIGTIFSIMGFVFGIFALVIDLLDVFG